MVYYLRITQGDKARPRFREIRDDVGDEFPPPFGESRTGQIKGYFRPTQATFD
ncbi:MAG: hypothetical protein P1V20_17510 [Verrucomicrobiales bacterium]|nr:hypothetical protein [Verrucomicrobiales bacterium]